MLSKLARPIEKLPLINQANKLLGGIVGALLGLVVVFLGVYMLYFVAILIDPNSGLIEEVRNTYIVSFINSISPFNIILGGNYLQ